MDIIVDVDCGNAPKQALVCDWLVAAAHDDVETVSALLSADASWEIVGIQTHHGRKEVAAAMTDHSSIERFHIARLLSHGKHVAAEGEVRHGDGTTGRFAHLLTFDGHGKNARVCEVVTFVVLTD